VLRLAPLLGSGGEQPGPVDQSEIANRADVLVYRSEPLEHDLEQTGPVTLDLWASIPRSDPDWIGLRGVILRSSHTTLPCPGTGTVRSRSTRGQGDRDEG
jgi:predicted acyl esterase